MIKLIRITTVSFSLSNLLKGQLKFMSENGFEVIGVSSPGEFLEDVRKTQQVKIVAIPMTRTISPFTDLKSLWQIYKLFKKEKPDIVHSHTPKAGTLAMIAAYLVGVPIRLHTIAGLPLLEATGGKRKLLDIVEKLTYACATKIYPNSVGIEDIIILNKYVKKEKLKIIGHGSTNGINTAKFNPELYYKDTLSQMRNELAIKKNDFIFLFLGRVVTDKGINELVRAFSNLEKKHSNIHLVIVGDYERHLDPLKSETEKEINSNAHIHPVGFKANVIDYYAFADVLTFPSYREGFPNVVMQAAAMQLNAIVTDINGCNEIITDGDNGWIVPVKDIKKLEERMLWCIENKEESKKMGLKSRKLMQQKYEQNFIWQETLKEYQSLLKAENIKYQK